MSESAPNADGVQFPGWYPDPGNELNERFWNGSQWSELTRNSAFPVHVPVSLLGPIDPSLQSLLDSFKHDHDLIDARTTSADQDASDSTSRV